MHNTDFLAVDPADLIDAREAAALLRVTPGSLRAMLSQGRLPLDRYRLGRANYFDRREVVAYIASRRIPAGRAAV